MTRTGSAKEGEGGGQHVETMGETDGRGREENNRGSGRGFLQKHQATCLCKNAVNSESLLLAKNILDRKGLT